MNDLMLNGKNLPAHAQATGGSNLSADMGGAGWPRLTFKGNRFRVNIGGDERVLGTLTTKLVILEANPHVSRVFYGTAYDSENASRPDCASADGITPLANVAAPQSKLCATCPQNEKGSAVTDTGGKTRACSFFKRVVVLLVDEPELGPLVADMKAMTMFGNSQPDKGAFSLRDYAKRLDQNKVMPYAVITEAGFDPNESVPKLVFRALDFTSAPFHDKYIAPLLDSGELQAMVSTSDLPTGAVVPPAEGAAAPTGFRDALSQRKPAHADPTATPPAATEVPAASGEPTPAQKAAKTRAEKKAKAEADAKAAADKAAAEHAAASEGEDEGGEMVFDAKLEDALAEFGF
jgi:hypothetical protein